MSKFYHIFLLFTLFTLHGFAQVTYNRSFSYDANGNRISSALLIAKSDGSGRGTMKEEEYLTSATDTLLDMTVNIYPNPTNDRVFVSTVAGEACGSLKARLMTTTGVLLEERLIENTAESFDMAGRASGIYLLEIGGNGEQHLWKILKR